MERNRTSQVIAIIALFVGILGLSVGFAAFSNSLNIKSSANVKADSSLFNVDFSSSQTEVLTNDITATGNPTDLVTTAGKIDNSADPTISGLSTTFTQPGQTATYKFYAYNAGELKAYLKSIVFANVTGKSSTKVCTASEGTTESLVTAACDSISISVKVGSENATTSGVASISNHLLDKATGEEVIVTLTYAENAELTDGDFTVEFGDITLNYSSVD